jgi:hypothetical protein
MLAWARKRDASVSVITAIGVAGVEGVEGVEGVVGVEAVAGVVDAAPASGSGESLPPQAAKPASRVSPGRWARPVRWG